MKRNPGYIIAGIIFFGFLVIAYAANAIFIRNYSKEIEKKKFEIEVLLNENKELRTIYESLIAKDRIISIATNQLKMIFPKESPEALIISKDKLRSLEEN
ncbi:MAG: hypothetical protein ACPL25_08690 [Ignavibacteria bacterium]